jgi:hypothetical protein
MSEPMRIRPILPMAVDVAALDAWMRKAVPGDSIVWATGPTVPRAGATSHLVREWADSGLVRNDPNAKVNGVWQFRITRMAAQMGGQLQAGTPLDADAVLKLLANYAAANAEVPTNAELARLAGLRNVAMLRSRIDKLKRAGLVRFEGAAPNELRRVVVLAPT